VHLSRRKKYRECLERPRNNVSDTSTPYPPLTRPASCPRSCSPRPGSQAKPKNTVQIQKPSSTSSNVSCAVIACPSFMSPLFQGLLESLPAASALFDSSCTGTFKGMKSIESSLSRARSFRRRDSPCCPAERFTGEGIDTLTDRRKVPINGGKAEHYYKSIYGSEYIRFRGSRLRGKRKVDQSHGFWFLPAIHDPCF